MHRHDAAFIVELANRIFGDAAKAKEWLHRPSLQLGGRTPMEILGTQEGAWRVGELLTQIDDDKRLHH